MRSVPDFHSAPASSLRLGLPSIGLFGLFGLLSVVLSVMVALPAQAQQQSGDYGRHLVTSAAPVKPAKPNPVLVGALTDLKTSLEKMTSKSDTTGAWTTGQDKADRAIFILPADSPLVSDQDRARLADKGPETFLIHSNDSNELWIIANKDQGLAHGIYYYLDLLGFRWYLPNEHWEIVPNLTSVAVTIDKLVSPAFITRSFFGTGGFGPRTPVDPTLEMRPRWTTWQQRNGFGSQLSSYGHVGHAFVMRHLKEFKAHPQYAALVDGKRVDPKPGIKFCVSNPDVMKLFIQDRLEALGQSIAKHPGEMTSRFVGVAPADGGGYCTCDNCKAIGNGLISDQVFYTANQVAKAVAEKYPGHGVSMYAYDAFARIPSIKLEPNMQIWFIPYAFQRTGMTGDQLLDAWQKKLIHDHVDPTIPQGLYTYWSITDWSRNLPDFDFVHTPKERIDFWHDKGIRALSFESTYSGGSMALGFYLASKLMWDPSTDVQPLIDEYFRLCYGKAEKPMRHMLLGWTSNHIMTHQLIAEAFADLHEAYSLTSDPAVRLRLDDYARYVQYLRSYYEFSNARDDDRLPAAKAYLDLIWRIYPSAMVQTYRLGQLMHARWGAALDIKNYFDTRKPGPEWKTLAAPDAQEVQGWVNQGVKDYPPLDFQTRTFTGKLEPLIDPGSPANSGTTLIVNTALRSLYSVTIHAWIAPGVKTFPLDLKAGHRGNRTLNVTVYGPDNKQLDSHEVHAPEAPEASKAKGAKTPQAKPTGPIQIATPVPGLYRIEIFNQKVGLNVSLPTGIRAVISPIIPIGFTPRLYFYVPKGLRTLALVNPPLPASPATIYRPDGSKLVLKQTGPLVLIDVPKGMDGKAWSIVRNSASKPIQMLNAPANFSFWPDTLLIPHDAR